MPFRRRPSSGIMSVHQVGIDISKSWFDAHVCGREARFPNDEQGFADLLSWLGEGSFHVCLEPTGGHERQLRRALEETEIPVSLAHPSKVASYARMMGRTHKTDKVDARMLAEYLSVAGPPASKLGREQRRELRRLVLSWKSLQGQLLMVESQLRSPEFHDSARSGMEAARTGIEMAMMALMDEVDRLLARQADLCEDVRLLESIKGIGRVSALQILAHLPEGDLRSARELASYAGTVPCMRESGSSVRGRSRVSPRCNRRLRSVLYMCALVSRRFCPHLKAFGDRLAERGKTKKQVIVAVMRKLAHAIYAVLSQKVSYNGEKLCRAT